MLKITQKEFDDRLMDKVGRELLTIPGIYEIVAEYYNNEIVDEITEQRIADFTGD